MKNLDNLLGALVPGFLKSMDRYFLLNYRLLWVSKIHYVLFFGLTALSSIFVFSRFLPMSPASYVHPGIFITVLSFLTLFPALYWVSKQINFRIEERFGLRFRFMEQARMLLYLACFGTFLSIPIIGGKMYESRLAGLVSDSELTQDIDRLNVGNPFFPTYDYRDNIKNSEDNGYEYVQFAPYSYFPDGYWMNEAEVQHTFEQKTAKEERLALIENYITTYNKYGGRIEVSAEEVLSFSENDNISDFTAFLDLTDNGGTNGVSSKKLDIKNSIQLLTEAKSGNIIPFSEPDFPLGVFMAILSGAVLLTIFNYVGMRTFFISAAAVAFLGLISGIFTVFTQEALGSGIGRNGALFFLITSGIYFFAVIKSFGLFTAKKYSLFQAVCLILVTVGGPFLLVWLSELSSGLHMGHFFGSGSDGMRFTFWTGASFFLVFMLPVLHRMYIRLAVLPRG